MRTRLQKTVIFLVAYLMLTAYSYGQEITFNRVSPPEGGNFNFVTGITQDPTGIMWFSTKQGLYKYNGNQLKSYQYNTFNPNSLSSNFLEYIYADYDGIIWIGTLGSGLNRFDPETETFTHYQHDPDNPASLSSDTVTCILRDKQGVLWVGTHGGLDKLDEQTNSFSHFRHDKNDSTSISNSQVREMLEDKQGVLWIGTGSPYPDNGGAPEDGGLNRMNKSTGTFTRYLHDANNNESLISNKISAIFEDQQGNLWIGTSLNGLHRMNREKGTFERLIYDPAFPEKFSGPPSDREAEIYENITFINQDIAGNYWYGTAADGLYFFNSKEKKLIHYTNNEDNSTGFIENGAWTAFNSRDGVFWIGGTTQGNIYRINPIKIEIPYYSTPAGVNGFYEEPNGNLWIAREDSLIIADKNKQTIKRYRFDYSPDFTNDNWTQIIKEDRQGNLWSGGSGGLFLWDEKHENYINYRHDPQNKNSISDGRVLSFYAENDKNLWIGTVNGLNQFNPETGVFSAYYFRLDDTVRIGNNVILAVLKDKTGNFWAGLSNGGGVFLFNPETRKSKNYLKGSDILKLYEDSDGVLWLGCSNGLFRFSPNDDNFIRYSDPGLMSGIQVAYSIEEDNLHYLWVSSNMGLIRINPERNQSRKFGVNFGILTNSWYLASGYKARNGNLYFGFESGYYEINPEELLKNQKEPEIIFSGFRLADQTVKPGINETLKESISKTKEIILQYFQNVFSFDFAIIDYANPGYNQLIYQLENYDKNWIQSNTENRAYYFNVPPGNYTFRVKGANSYGVWAEKKLNIVILPPWYKTSWAYGFYVLILIGGVFGFDRFQRRRILLLERKKAQKRDLEHAREIEKAYNELRATQSQLIISEKMASLGELTAGIAHEIQNPLNFVNNFSEINSELIEELEEEAEKGNLEEIKSIAKDIKENEHKIINHGKRAESIVKGMLLHSRGSSGDKEPTDINALCDEYLRLSYHGFRAKEKSFNADFKLDTDEKLPKIKVVPQEIGRVVLNLVNNAFYAVDKQAKSGIVNYKPQIKVKTTFFPSSGGLSHPDAPAGKEGAVVISISDNGQGIPDTIQKKIFQPFFTTKPTGQGTGLGLSLSYDIVKAHGGEIKVESKEGEGTEFTIILPVSNIK